MQFDFVIVLSVIVVVAMLVGMAYAGYYVKRHIEIDSKQ